MSSRFRPLAARLPVAAALLLIASPAQASFHLWDFSEVFSNQDGSIQFLELHCPQSGAGENFIANHQLKSAAHSFMVPTNLPAGSTANKFFLFATAGFAALPGAITPNYIIPDGFFNPAGDTLNWANVDTLTFTAGQLPLDGELSLLDDLTTALNSPTNFAGAVGHINLTPPATPGDTDGDGDVDLEDLNNVRNNFGATGPDITGDTNNDDLVDLEDLNAVRNNFGSAAVPEPTAGALAVLSVLAIAVLRKSRGI